MKKLTLLLIILISLSSCGVQWQYTSLNTAGHIDGIYRSNDFKIDTINSVSDLRWKLRTDFQFRLDFAQYALNQPQSFDWNNRILGNRYSFYNPYLGYNSFWDRTQMWNDWVWNYPYNNWGWNSGWNRWGYNNWNTPYLYGWNRPWNSWNYYHPYYRRGRINVAYVNGYRARTSSIYNNTTNRLNINKNDQTTRSNKRTRRVKTQSYSNGGRSRSRQVVPNQTIRINQPTNVQPRQIRRRPSTPVPQQPVRSQRPSRQRRSSSSEIGRAHV